MLQSTGEQHRLERLSGRVLKVQQQERLTHKPYPLHICLLYTTKLRVYINSGKFGKIFDDQFGKLSKERQIYRFADSYLFFITKLKYH